MWGFVKNEVSKKSTKKKGQLGRKSSRKSYKMRQDGQMTDSGENGNQIRLNYLWK